MSATSAILFQNEFQAYIYIFESDITSSEIFDLKFNALVPMRRISGRKSNNGLVWLTQSNILNFQSETMYSFLPKQLNSGRIAVPLNDLPNFHQLKSGNKNIKKKKKKEFKS